MNGHPIRLFPNELRKLFESENGPVAKELSRRALKVDRKAKQLLSIPGTGRTYGKHVASAPGQPPSPDFGTLRSSVSWEVAKDAKGLVGRVGTNLEYGKHLELGTKRIAARPFLRPALDEADR